VLSFLSDWAIETRGIILQAAPWLVGGFLLAGVIYVLVPFAKVTKHFGKPGLAGVLKATLLGAPLPLCSCSVLPIASSLRRQGASRGATASFLVSTPATGVDSIAVSYALLGPVLAIVRPIAAVVAAILAGTMIDRLVPEDPQASSADDPLTSPSRGGATEQPRACCEGEAAATGHAAGQARSCCHGKATASVRSSKIGLVAGARQALRHGFVSMFERLGHWLLLGFVLAGLVSAALPADLLPEYVGSGPLAMLLMVPIGLPMYVCATSSTPVAAALIAKGLSPGAAVVFLLVGPATSTASMFVVGKDLGGRGLALYLISIVIVALVFGIVTDLWVASSPAFSVATADACHGHGETPPWYAWPLGVFLTLLMLNGLYRKLMQIRAARRVPIPAQVSVSLTATEGNCCH